MYSSRGPVCDIYDEKILEQLTQGIKEIAKKYKAFVFKIERYLDKIKSSNSLGPGEYLPLTKVHKYNISKESTLPSIKEYPQ